MNNDPTEVFADIKERAISNVNAKKQRTGINISIGKGTCGIAAGALETQKAVEATLEQEGIQASVFSTGCMGHCYAEPVVIVDNPDSGFPPVFYHQVTPGKARMIIKSFLIDGDPLFEHMMGAMVQNDLIPSIMDFPRFNSEERIVLEKCGAMDPNEIDEIRSGCESGEFPGHARRARYCRRSRNSRRRKSMRSCRRGRR